MAKAVRPRERPQITLAVASSSRLAMLGWYQGGMSVPGILELNSDSMMKKVTVVLGRPVVVSEVYLAHILNVLCRYRCRMPPAPQFAVLPPLEYVKNLANAKELFSS